MQTQSLTTTELGMVSGGNGVLDSIFDVFRDAPVDTTLDIGVCIGNVMQISGNDEILKKIGIIIGAVSDCTAAVLPFTEAYNDYQRGAEFAEWFYYQEIANRWTENDPAYMYQQSYDQMMDEFNQLFDATYGQPDFNFFPNADLEWAGYTAGDPMSINVSCCS